MNPKIYNNKLVLVWQRIKKNKKNKKKETKNQVYSGDFIIFYR